MTEEMSLRSINAKISQYSLNPSELGTTTKIKRFTNTKSMSEALYTLAEKVKGTGISENLSTLENLKSNISSLEKKESKLSLKRSILHKTNKIADFFHSIWDPSFKDAKQDSVFFARQGLAELSKVLDEEIVKAQTDRLRTGKDILKGRLDAADQLMEKLAEVPSDFEWDDLIIMHQNPSFQSLLETSQFHEKKTTTAKMEELDRLWREGCALLAPDQNDEDGKQSVLVLLVLHLDIDHSFLKSQENHSASLGPLSKNLTEAIKKTGGLTSTKTERFTSYLKEKLEEEKEFIEFNNRQMHLTPQNLMESKPKFMANLSKIFNSDSANEAKAFAKFAMEEEVNKALEEKAPLYDKLETDAERFQFITSLYEMVCAHYLAFLSKEQGRPVVLEGTEKLDAMLLVILKVNVDPSLTFFELDLSHNEKIGPPGQVMSNISLAMGYLTSFSPTS